jgi:hypothetical protein
VNRDDHLDRVPVLDVIAGYPTGAVVQVGRIRGDRLVGCGPHSAIREMMAENHRRDIPDPILEAAETERDPDRRIMLMLGARGSRTDH